MMLRVGLHPFTPGMVDFSCAAGGGKQAGIAAPSSAYLTNLLL